jgi:hypothetical protein
MLVLRVVAAAILAVILGNHASLLRATSDPGHSLLCGCAPRSCRCDHGEDKQAAPACHRARGSSSGPFVRCASQEDLALRDSVPAVLFAATSLTTTLVVQESARLPIAPRPSGEVLEILTPPS